MKAKLTKDFIKKVISLMSVDTKLYRYIVYERPDFYQIKRLPIAKLDTTAALTEWEVVWDSRTDEKP